jgi:hypothetical protein
MKPPSRAHRAAYVFWVRPAWEAWRHDRTDENRQRAIDATLEVLSRYGGRGRGPVLRDIRKRYGWRPTEIGQTLRLYFSNHIGELAQREHPLIAMLKRARPEARP